MLSKPKLIVFPTSRAIRSYLNKNSDSNMLLPTLLTIDDFLKKSIVIDNYKYCDEEQRIILLKKACDDIDLKSLGISIEFSKFINQSEYIYRFLNELASEKIEIDDLNKFDTYDFYIEHLSILKQIKENYIKVLEENLYVDKINLASKYKINESFINKFEDISINFEGYFTNVEFEIIQKISKIKSLFINFSKNIYNKKSLLKIIDNIDELEDDYNYIFDLSNNSLVSKEKLDLNYKLEIKGFSQRINQLAFIKKSITDTIENGTNVNNIALVIPDEKFAKQLQLFDSENYFNYAMGKSIENELIYQVSYAIYSYILEDEFKYIENLKFYNLEKSFIDNEIKPLFKKMITKSNFEFITNYLKTYIDNDELKSKYDELVYRFNYLIFSFENQLTIKDAFRIFLQKLSKITLDDVNSGKVTVMGLLETRNISFDTVIITDFNEEFIPKKSVKDKFLSTNIKEAVGLPTSKNREDLQKYYYKRLIENSKEVYISFVNNDTSTISRFASQIFKEKIDSELSSDNSYKHILYKNNHLLHSDEKIVEQIDLTKISWSASSLKTFLECKRKYYLKSILSIKEHEISLKPKSFELGSIIHAILEKYQQSTDRSMENLMSIFNEYKSNNPFLVFDLQIWKKKLENYYEFENQYLSNNQFISCEEEFNAIFNGIKIKGKMDRLDKVINTSGNETYEIIDYKTSSSLKVDTSRTYEKSKDFQLEFYFLGVNQKYKTNSIKTYYFDLYNIKLLEEVMLEKKLEVLSGIFDEFKELSKEKISFDKCEEKSTCQYCSYKTICNRQ